MEPRETETKKLAVLTIVRVLATWPSTHPRTILTFEVSPATRAVQWFKG